MKFNINLDLEHVSLWELTTEYAEELPEIIVRSKTVAKKIFCNSDCTPFDIENYLKGK
jgi:hypothetical protein